MSNSCCVLTQSIHCGVIIFYILSRDYKNSKRGNELKKISIKMLHSNTKILDTLHIQMHNKQKRKFHSNNL